MRSRHTIRLILALAALTLANPARAQDFGPPGSRRPLSAEQLVSVRCQTDADVIHPGQRFELAVVFQIEPGWHIYWANPGASGMATDVQVKGPSGFEIGSPRFTRPRVFQEPEGVVFGYEREAALFIPVTAPAQLDRGQATFDLAPTWLVCKGMCLLGSVERTVEVATSSDPPVAATSRPDASLAAHRRRLPQPLADLPGGRVAFDGATLEVTGPTGAFVQGAFFPIELPGVTYGDGQMRFEDRHFILRVPVTLKPANAQGRPLIVSGLIALGERLEDPCYEFQLPAGDGAG